eukprot:13378481-Alexandrium_andersonii.AAC.1
MGGPPCGSLAGAVPLGHAKASLAWAGFFGSAQRALGACQFLRVPPGPEGRVLTGSAFVYISHPFWTSFWLVPIKG